MTSKAWLDALLDDGPLPENAADAPSAWVKLAQLQRAFAGLSPTAADLAAFDSPSQPLQVEDTGPALFQWDRLRVLEQLGQGGFGAVYRARDPMLQRTVALKLRAADAQVSDAAERAFIEEARRLAQVRHPNVLAVHGAAIDQGRAGIWTDLIDGQTLAARLTEQGPLAAPALLHLITSLAAALGAVHAQAIVHGDLKPANVMWEALGDRVVLMDFGAGGRLDAEGRTQLRAGSLQYMAPEQRSGAPLGTAADLYALGATALYAATGLAPQQAQAWTVLDARRDLSKRFRQLLRQLLAVDPAQRPTAEGVVARCHDLQAEPERQRRWRRRAFVFALLALAVLATGTALLLALKARDEVATERNRAVSTRDFLLSVLRSPNPYQTTEPTRTLEQLFEQAVAKLPEALPDDPQTAAQLLQQFGRSLIILDRDTSAVAALERADALLAAAGTPPGTATRVEVRSFLSDVYRRLRRFEQARVLTDAQAALCVPGAAAPPTARTCVAIVNDQIEAAGFGGDPHRALALAGENLARAQAAGLLEQDYEAVFTLYLKGVMERELGRTSVAADSFIELTRRTLALVPASHPGLLTDLMLLAGSADDLGDADLARALNADALAGRTALYGRGSRYAVQVALQRVQLALHAGADDTLAQARALLAELPDAPFVAPYRDRLLVLAAQAGATEIDATTLAAVAARARDNHRPESSMLAERRLDLAAVALRRGQPAQANDWLTQARPAVAGSNGEGLRDLLRVLEQHAEGADERSEAAVAARVFDPVRGVWLGPVPDGAAARLRQIRALAAQVRQRRLGQLP